MAEPELAWTWPTVYQPIPALCLALGRCPSNRDDRRGYNRYPGGAKQSLRGILPSLLNVFWRGKFSLILQKTRLGTGFVQKGIGKWLI